MNQVKNTAIITMLLIAGLLPLANVSAQNAATKPAADLNGSGKAVSLHRDDKMDTSHTRFFKSNPKLLLLHWKKDGQILEVYLKREKIERYDLSDVGDVQKAEKTYGKLPSKAGGSYSL